MNQAQKTAEEMDRKIVKFTNIDNESFTHSYRGVSITIQAKESYTGRFPECDHLALHLARKMLSREAKKKTSKDDTKIKLWTPQDIDTLKAEIITSIGNINPETKDSPVEAREKDQRELKDKFPEKPSVPEVTKKDVIAELKKRGASVDIKKTREELLQQLMDLEAAGK